MKFLFLSLFLTFLTNHFVAAQVLDKWISVELSLEMNHHLGQLEEDEKIEQYRDWIKYGFIQSLKLNAKTSFEVLYDFNPLRYDYLILHSNFEYGESRSFQWSDGTLFILVPYDSPQKRNGIVRAFDEYRMFHGKVPIKTHVIDYQINTSQFSARYRPAMQIESAQLLSEAYGYIEAMVRNPTDLQRFIESIDDISFGQNKENGVLLGGRKYENFQGKSVTIEDIAVLYQADNHIKEDYIAKLGKRGLANEYKNFKAHLQKQLNGKTILEMQKAIEDYLPLLESKAITDKSRREIKQVKEFLNLLQQAASYSHFVDFYKKNLIVSSDDLNIGFSLDSQTKYKELSNALQRIINADTLFMDNWYDKNIREQDKKLMILEFKKEQAESNPIKNEAELWFNSEDFNTFEVSFKTFVFGNDSLMLSKNNIYDFLLQKDSLEPAVLEQLLEREKKAIHLVTQKYKPILSQILSSIQHETEDSKKLSLYFEWIGLLENRIVLNIGDSTQVLDADEKITNQFAIQLIIRLLQTNDYLAKEEVNYTENVKQAVRAFQVNFSLMETGIVDNETFVKLLDATPYIKIELYTLKNLLKHLLHAYSYQKGRYDGNLQGTAVGMTLFYTDLMMKLWGFDYQNTAPKKAVLGFQPETNYLISSVYRRDIELNPSTRSWLGALREGFDFYDNGNILLFSHGATRIYNASPNDLVPGVEAAANKSSERFAHWWNSHYSQIADYEAEYHRLNQIMKWTTIVHWLKNKNQTIGLNHKNLVKTTYWDFENWYAQNKDLKTSVPIPFLDKHALDETTECIDMIHSEPYLPFKKELIIFGFTGGVSLGKKGDIGVEMKLNKQGSIIQSGFNRKNIDSKKIINVEKQIVTYGKTNYQLDIPNKNCKIVFDKSITSKSKVAEVFDLTMERTVQEHQLVQKSIKEQLELGTVSATIEPNVVKLAMKESDISKITNFVESIGNQSLDEVVTHAVQVEFAFLIPKSTKKGYIVKLKGMDNWLELKETTIPANPHENAWYEGLDLRFAFRQKTYLDVSYKTAAEVERVVKTFDWQEIGHAWENKGGITLTNVPPAEVQNKLFFQKGAVTTEIMVSKKAFYLKNKDWKENLPISHLLKDGNEAISSQLNSHQNFVGLIFNPQKEPFIFSNAKIEVHLGTPLENLFLEQPQLIKAVLTSDDIKNVRFTGESTLLIPKELTLNDKEVINFINKKVNSDNRWINLLKKEAAISHRDITVLSQINDKANFNLCESYYQFKQIDNLMPDNVVSDLMSNSIPPQFLIKKYQDNPQVITLTQKCDETVAKTCQGMTKMYLESNKNYTLEDIKGFLQPLEQLQNVLRSQVGSRAKVITKESAGINFEVVNKLFEPSTEIRFIKDKARIQESIDHVQTSITVDHDKSIVLTTTDLANSEVAEITNIYSSIQQSNVAINPSTSAADFAAVMANKNHQQIFLLVRTNQKGLVFSDRVMPFEEVHQFSRDFAKKDLIYVISNGADTLESIFAETGRFKYVITNLYRLGNPVTAQYALEHLKAYFDSYLEDKIQIKERTYQKLLKKHPELGGILDEKVSTTNKKVTIEIGKLNKQQYDKLPQKIKDWTNKLLGKKDKYQPKKVEDIINKYQREQILQLKGKPYNDTLLKIKGIPHLKCSIDITKNNKIC